MAGSSGTPLAGKLGIKEGHRVVLLGAPDALLEPLPAVELATTLGDEIWSGLRLVVRVENRPGRQ